MGSKAIPGLKEGLQRVNSTVGTSSKTVPFMFLSNGGGCSESEKAALINKVSGLVTENNNGSGGPAEVSNGDAVACLRPDQVFLASTMLKSKNILDRFSDKWIAIDGYGKDDVKLAMSYGYKKVISALEI